VLTSQLLLVIIGIYHSYNGFVIARTWDSIVDKTIYSSAMIDPYRAMGKEFAVSPTPTIDTTAPTVSPTSYPLASIINTPTIAPSTSYTPTIIQKCTEPNEYTTVIRKYDSWGDGWGDTKMIITKPTTTIDTQSNIPNNTFDSFVDLFTVNVEASRSSYVTVYEGSLANGNEELSDLCLSSNVCYTIEVNGTTTEWQDEIKWDIRQNTTNDTQITLAKGFAPTKCQFSIWDSISESYACNPSCEYNRTNDDDEMMYTTSPSQSFVPSIVPSSIPSNYESTNSDYPSSIDTTGPTNKPSLLPTSISSGGSAIIDTVPEEPSFSPTTISIRPSSMGTSTFLPTVTFQPTATMYPTAHIAGVIYTGSGSDSGSSWTDDDTFLHAPVDTPISSDSVSLHPTNTAPPSSYGAEFANSLVTDFSAGTFSKVEKVALDEVPTPTPVKNAPSKIDFSGTSSASIIDKYSFASVKIDPRDNTGSAKILVGSATITTPETTVDNRDSTGSATIFFGSASVTAPVPSPRNIDNTALQTTQSIVTPIHRTNVVPTPVASPIHTHSGKKLFQSVFLAPTYLSDKIPTPKTTSPYNEGNSFLQTILQLLPPPTQPYSNSQSELMKSKPTNAGTSYKTTTAYQPTKTLYPTTTAHPTTTTYDPTTTNHPTAGALIPAIQINFPSSNERPKFTLRSIFQRSGASPPISVTIVSEDDRKRSRQSFGRQRNSNI
jgi:hypothetical protein